MEPGWRASTSHAEPAEIAPGIWRLPVPLPGHSIGHVNSYALIAPEGVLLIDVGWRSEESWDALDQLLRGIGSSARDVRRVLLTHFHPDHCGQAALFLDASIGMHPTDAGHLYDRFVDQTPYRAEMMRWVEATGSPDSVRELSLTQLTRSKARVAPLVPDHLVVDGEVIKHDRWELTAFHTPGHTGGHLCFYERTTRLLFSGDHMFPHIKTSPAYRPQCSPDPVGDYLRSMTRLATLPIDLVLPGHQEPFEGFGERLGQLRDHHAERLSLCERLVAEGAQTVWEVASLVPRSRAWDQLNVAAKISSMGETYAHLVHLATSGRATRSGTAPITWDV